jgi:hypothetical protein
MNRFLLVIVLALALPIAARADDASHRAKAQEMMALIRTQQMVEQNSKSMKKQITDAAQATIGLDATPEKKAQAEAFEKKAFDLIDTQLGWASMQPGITDIYVKALTEDQLDGIIAFYKTPAGAALLTTMPEVSSQVNQFGSARIKDSLTPQLTQMFLAFRASMAPAPAAAAAPATAAPAASPAVKPAPATPAAKPAVKATPKATGTAAKPGTAK